MTRVRALFRLIKVALEATRKPNGDQTMKKISLLVTNNGNTKIRKSAEGTEYKIASLSLSPDDIICANRKRAECAVDCLFKAGRGVMSNVERSRRGKTKLWHTNREQFLDILYTEIKAHIRSSKRAGKIAAIRLNTISDISWEEHDIFQQFPELIGYDYTKRPERIGKTPENYRLMFSYSGAPLYQPMVEDALKTDVPISVVFRGGFPKEFLGREVVNGDKSDLYNLEASGKVIGLKLKGGKQIQLSKSPFIVNNPEPLQVAA